MFCIDCVMGWGHDGWFDLDSYIAAMGSKEHEAFTKMMQGEFIKKAAERSGLRFERRTEGEVNTVCHYCNERPAMGYVHLHIFGIYALPICSRCQGDMVDKMNAEQ